MLGRIEIRQIPQGFVLHRRSWLKSEWFGRIPVNYADGDDYHNRWDEDPIRRIIFQTETEAREFLKPMLHEQARQKALMDAAKQQRALAENKGVIVGYIDAEEAK